MNDKPSICNQLQLPENPARWIEDLQKPTWDAYFLSIVFLAAMRSPDQETKQGCVIVDWNTKVVLGTGYNGHPRGTVAYAERELLAPAYFATPLGIAGAKASGLTVKEAPTKRPGKYPFMVHADLNAALNCRGTSDHAVCYLPMPPCEVCLGTLANLPTIRINRIVYLESRDFPNTIAVARHLPHIKFEKYQGQHPAEVLMNAATYALLRSTKGKELSANSTTTYVGGK